MPHLLRPLHKPKLEELSPNESKYIQQHFDANSVELNFDGQFLEYGRIDEVEIAAAARTRNPAGWFVKNVIYGGNDRFHVGMYYGHHELVIPNLTLKQAQYIVGVVAFYARTRIKYTGPDGLVSTDE